VLGAAAASGRADEGDGGGSLFGLAETPELVVVVGGGGVKREGRKEKEVRERERGGAVCFVFFSKKRGKEKIAKSFASFRREEEKGRFVFSLCSSTKRASLRELRDECVATAQGLNERAGEDGEREKTRCDCHLPSVDVLIDAIDCSFQKKLFSFFFTLTSLSSPPVTTRPDRFMSIPNTGSPECQTTWSVLAFIVERFFLFYSNERKKGRSVSRSNDNAHKQKKKERE